MDGGSVKGFVILVMDFLSIRGSRAESGRDSAQPFCGRTFQRAIPSRGASIVREHRPVIDGACIPVENQNSAVAEIEFGMRGLGFYRGLRAVPGKFRVDDRADLIFREDRA